MKTTTATALRKNLFRVLDKAIHAFPTHVQYKQGSAVILSYRQYLALKRGKKILKGGKKLEPLLSGKICKPLNEAAEEELMRYMGF